MPLDRLVLILVCVVAAAGATVWLAAVLMASSVAPWGLAALIPAGLAAYVAVRVIRDRATSEEDARYDRVER